MARNFTRAGIRCISPKPGRSPSLRYTEATTTQLIDPAVCDWDRELIERLGYPVEIFQKVVQPGTVLGELTDEVSETIGYRCKVILPAAHDTASAILAMPSTDPDTVYISSGTWFQRDVAFAVNKEETTLLKILNKTILRLKKKDVLVKAQEKWFGISSPVIKKGTTYDIALYLSLAIAAAMLLIGIWNMTMRQKIREKTLQLAVNEENLHAIIDSLYAKLIVIDGKGRIVECNRALLEELNAEEEALIGTEIEEYPLLHSLFYQEDGETAQESREKQQVIYQNRYFDVTKHRLQPSLENTLMVFEDVTDKVIYEQQMRQEVKMDAINHLSVGFAHEVRNPLGIIRNYLFILRGEVRSSVGLNAVEAAEKAVNRINSLITNLLHFARIEKDCRAEIDLRKLMNEILALEEKRLREHQILVELTGEENVLLQSNTESLKVIFLNLIENSIDAIAAKKNSQGKIQITIDRDGRNVKVLLRDNGGGIPKAVQEQVFNAFFTTKEKGTGLGLYLVQNEVKKIDGDVQLQSRTGEGTTFTIRLPEK